MGYIKKIYYAFRKTKIKTKEASYVRISITD